MQLRAVVAGVLLLAVGAYAGADAVDVAPGVLTLTAVPAAPTPSPRPTPVDPTRTPAGDVLPRLAASAPLPDPASLAARLRPLLAAPALGPRVSAVVSDAATGRLLLDVGSARPMVPASTVKLLTAAATLTTVGPQTRLVTRAVQGGSPQEVVLVGGGDMLLARGRGGTAAAGRAGLGDLAGQVAKALGEQGVGRVVVRFDDSLLDAARAAPGWNQADLAVGYTGRVAALGLASDRARPGRPSSTDPAATAASAFAQALTAAGVGVTGRPQRLRAAGQARVLGSVRSAPVGDVLDLALTESDNALTELLAMLTARAMGRPATFGEGARAVVDQVASLGVDVSSTRVQDASGLSRLSAVPAATLARLLTLAASGKEPRLSGMLDAIPVAGFTGTLTDRFGATRTRPAAGVVRAKTGTLTGITTLAGTVVDADGRLLVVVVMTDQVPAGGTVAARSAVDQVAAAVATCGCR